MFSFSLKGRGELNQDCHVVSKPFAHAIFLIGTFHMFTHSKENRNFGGAQLDQENATL